MLLRDYVQQENLARNITVMRHPDHNVFENAGDMLGSSREVHSH
jgi:hypothetical protein